MLRFRVATLIAAGVVLASGVMLAASPAAAQYTLGGINQYTLGGMSLEGEVETGVRFFIDEPSKTRSGKLQEYRDIDDGLFLGRFYLRAFKPDESYSSEFEGSNWGGEDQSFGLRTGRLGLWEFGFEWDQMRHVLYTNTRLLAAEADRGVFVLPSPRPALATHNAAPERELSVRWDTAKMAFKLTPTPDLDLKAEYTRIRKDGDRPMGMAFGSPGGNFYEVLEPIEHTIHDFRIQGVYAKERWQVQFGYVLSVFENDERRIVADNPCFGNAAPNCSAGDAGGPARGQSSLPPSNMAHTFNLAAGVTLPMRSRIHGNVAYSLRLQNDSFLPHTINPARDGDVDLRLPQNSLNGNVQIVNMNLVGTTQPWTNAGVTTKYRFYQQIDLSDQPTFPGVIPNDNSISRDAHKSHHFDFKRHNADVDVRLTFLKPVTITVGPGWERWDRNEGREVRESDEFFGKLALDSAPWDWMQARLTYKPSWRRLAHYNTFAHQEHVVVEDAAGELAGQSVLLRKFDEAERNRQRIDALVTFAPSEILTVTPTLGWRFDDYLDSRIGLQEENSFSAGIDVAVTPSHWVSFTGGYVYEKTSQRQRQRNRITGTAPNPPTTDFVDWDWISHNEDTVHTAYASLQGDILPRRLEWSTRATWSYALGTINTNNPIFPQLDGQTAAQRYTAMAKPLPAFEDELWRLEAKLKYHLSPAWTATLGYAWESFSKHDWRTDGLNPFIPVSSGAGLTGQSSIWQGNDLKNYGTHILGMTLSYRFGK